MILTVTLNPCVHRYLVYREEAPPRTVVRGVRERSSAGGKGLNAARVIVRLGGEAVALSTASGPTGAMLRECLAREGVVAELVPVAAPTRLSTCLYDLAHDHFREFLEEGGSGDEREAEMLRVRFATLLTQVTTVTVNGSTPPGPFSALPREFVAAARAAGKRVVLDAYGPAANEAARVPPHWVRANLDELRSTNGLASTAELPRLREQLGADGILVSDGPHALHCVSGSGHLIVAPPSIREVNAVGSGDALTGAFALALDQGRSLEEALRYGAAAGSANAEQLLVCEFEAARWRELQSGVVIRSAR